MSKSALATACWLQDWVNQPSRKSLSPPALTPLLSGQSRQSSPASNSRIRLINAYPLQGHPLPQTDIPGFSSQPTIQCT